MNTEKLKSIIKRLRNNSNQSLSMTYVAKEYSKLDLINDLEEILEKQEIMNENGCSEQGAEEFQNEFSTQNLKKDARSDETEDFKDRCG